MNKPTLEQRLIAAMPDQPVDAQFTDRVMGSVQHHEIISDVVRKTNVKPKETFMMKLRHLHKPAIIALAVAITFAAAGTAYAVYLLWPKPTVDTTISKPTPQGRVEVIAHMKDCENAGTAQKSYELKKNSQINADQVADVLQGKCEMDAIQSWVKKQPEAFYRPPTSPDQDSDSLNGFHVSNIETIQGNTITLSSTYFSHKSNHQITLQENTKVIVEGAYGKRSDLKPGDRIMPIVKSTYKPKATSPYKEKLLYVFKMALPMEAYEHKAQLSLAERTPCIGNEEDTCVNSSAIPILAIQPAKRLKPEGSTFREFQGKLLTIEATGFTLQGSSGRIVTAIMGKDVIADFHQNRAKNYPGITVKPGDMIKVLYYTSPGADKALIQGDLVSDVYLMTETVNKLDPSRKY